MIPRPQARAELENALARAPVAAVLGPRQSGKTTLARAYSASRPATFFDLDSPQDRGKLRNPELLLGSLEGLVVLDEVQNLPELFPVLRVLADRDPNPAQFLILGSASPDLVRAASESLAGRVAFVELSGFDLREAGRENWMPLWVRGGFPRSYLAADEALSFAWREDFIRTFLERDIPQLGIRIAPAALRRFWTMLAHSHGQIWNASEIGRSLGVSDQTVRGYLDILTGTFMVRQLQPWFENTGKRQVKSPKVYFRDTGMLHSLFGLPDFLALSGHPKYGASWEGFVIEQVARILAPPELYFWGTHEGAELDLLFFKGGLRYGIEIKASEAPRITPSMRRMPDELDLTHLWVVYPGRDSYPVEERISVLSISELDRLPDEMEKFASA